MRAVLQPGEQGFEPKKQRKDRNFVLIKSEKRLMPTTTVQQAHKTDKELQPIATVQQEHVTDMFAAFKD